MACSLSWSAAPDNLKIAVFAHRAAAAGAPASLAQDGYACPDALAGAARAFGLDGAAGTAEDAATAVALAPPRIVLFSGAAIGYPYYAYYAHCLLSLGLAYTRADAGDITAGILDAADALIMPGGFATWGLDRAEDHDGVDEAIRRFLQRGGALVGSCGGAFYASQGRPGWLGLIDAKPVFTHEYLQTGAAVVNIRLTDEELGRGLPHTLELAYYHGPVYDDTPRQSETLGRYAEFALPSRLLIDNPLDRTRYETLMRDRPAILAAHGGRAIVFSPHPEMGDFVRKGIALDGYVRKYLPLRGLKTMDETLRFYGGEDCLGFRLVLNALVRLGLFGRDGASGGRPAPGRAPGTHDAAETLRDFERAWQSVFEHLKARADSEEPALRTLIDMELQRRFDEFTAETSRLRDHQAGGKTDPGILDELARVLRDATGFLGGASERPDADVLVSLELPVRLIAAGNRIFNCDQIIKEAL